MNIIDKEIKFFKENSVEDIREMLHMSEDPLCQDAGPNCEGCPIAEAGHSHCEKTPMIAPSVDPDACISWLEDFRKSNLS